MTPDITYELDRGSRLGVRLAAALGILLAPIAAKAAAVAGVLAIPADLGTTAYWLWVLVGGPAAFLLAQADVYAVRRVGLVFSPARARWEVAHGSLGGVDRAAGSTTDVVRVDLEPSGPHDAALRLVGQDGAVLAEVVAPMGPATDLQGRLQEALAAAAGRTPV